jgi:hypothetical protein
LFDIASKPMTKAKTLLGISTIVLIFAAVFGLLNAARVKGLESNLKNTADARDAAEQRRLAQEERLLTRRGTTSPAPATSPGAAATADTEGKAAKDEAALAQVLKDKADLQKKLQATQAEVASLQNRTPEPSVEAGALNPGAPSTAELQAQLDDTRRQLESAERENAFLSEKLGPGERLATSERTLSSRERSSATAQLQPKRREPSPPKAGVRGNVLAVNQAYNFVVLNLGNRQGLQANSDMLVFRGGARIGKIRISSVEPATAIGDIVTNSLARGVQVQPGDVVMYAGTH